MKYKDIEQRLKAHAVEAGIDENSFYFDNLDVLNLKRDAITYPRMCIIPPEIQVTTREYFDTELEFYLLHSWDRDNEPPTKLTRWDNMITTATIFRTKINEGIYFEVLDNLIIDPDYYLTINKDTAIRITCNIRVFC